MDRKKLKGLSFQHSQNWKGVKKKVAHRRESVGGLCSYSIATGDGDAQPGIDSPGAWTLIRQGLSEEHGGVCMA